ncbi:universal stress protein [Mycolicibacterium diernhoferi]|nr:universal stress protein [Mycolicibacterium diernhoferi]
MKMPGDRPAGTPDSEENRSPGGAPGVLVGIDGSASSTSAVRWAAREAMLRKLPLQIVHVMKWPSGPIWSEVLATPDIAADLTRNGEAVLRAAHQVAEEVIGGAVEIRVDDVVAADSIVGVLVDCSRSARMVVVGRRGMGAVSRWLLGSVTSALIRHARSPVVVVHDEDAESLPAAGTAPVVVGLDGSPASENALAFAFDEASWRAAPLVVVHAWGDADGEPLPGSQWERLRVLAEERVAERLAGWGEQYPDVLVHRDVVLDRPAHHLLQQSRTAQLTVVGSRGRGGFKGLLLGSVGKSVVEGAQTPVVVVPPDGSRGPENRMERNRS